MLPQGGIKLCCFSPPYILSIPRHRLGLSSCSLCRFHAFHDTPISVAAFPSPAKYVYMSKYDAFLFPGLDDPCNATGSVLRESMYLCGVLLGIFHDRIQLGEVCTLFRKYLF